MFLFLPFLLKSWASRHWIFQPPEYTERVGYVHSNTFLVTTFLSLGVPGYAENSFNRRFKFNFALI